MILKSIALLNYKSFSKINFDFHKKINCFVGKNGVGKTNVLDAIYLLANGKSYFNTLSVQNIKHDQDFFVVDGLFEKQNRSEQILCSIKRGQKKVLKRNGKVYEKFSDHVGLIPVVIISPSDQDLILDGSETRRKFLDSVISQTDHLYLQNLIKYQKIIQQRNALLKYFAINRVFENDTLEIYNAQLIEFGSQIFESRKSFIADFEPIFNKHYQTICDKQENVNLLYDSKLLKTDFGILLHENLQKDRLFQYTTVGTHRDDLLFQIDNQAIKKFGSQGQQKTFLIALKLAQFEFLKSKSGENPIVLFDDVFDKLDENRVQKIVEMVNSEVFGQLFITDTHQDRTQKILSAVDRQFKIFVLE